MNEPIFSTLNNKPGQCGAFSVQCVDEGGGSYGWDFGNALNDYANCQGCCTQPPCNQFTGGYYVNGTGTPEGFTIYCGACDASKVGQFCSDTILCNAPA
jgi:hypothetical protein